MSKVEFSLIVPCYNEEDCLEKTVSASIVVLNKLFKKYEIILIDDKSTDGTAKIIASLAKKYPVIKTQYNIINLGQGISFLIGLQLSRGELVMQNGADRPCDIHDLKTVLPYFPEYDIIIVARKDRSAYSFWRKLTSVANNLLRGILFGFEFNDLNFVQIYKRKVINNITIKARSAAFVTQELVLSAKQKGYQIKEICLPYHARMSGLAQHGKKRDILWALIDMINFRLEYKN